METNPEGPEVITGADVEVPEVEPEEVPEPVIGPGEDWTGADDDDPDPDPEPEPEPEPEGGEG
jgi:hypothetical protein